MAECYIDNHKFYFYERIESDTTIPPLLLIHGLSGQHINWPPQIRHMQGATVYAPDLPGHGRSEGEGCTSVGAYANNLLQFVDSLGIGQFIAAGHSMGGAIAQHMTLSFSDRVSGLILLSTGTRVRVSSQLLSQPPDGYDHMIDFLIEYAYGPNTPSTVKRLGHKLMEQAGYHITRSDLIACDNFDSTDRINEISCPTLVIGGTADQLTPARETRQLSAHIPNAEMHLIREAGHMVPVEEPTKVAEIVADWLVDHWGGKVTSRIGTGVLA